MMNETPAPPLNPQDGTPILPPRMSDTIAAIAKLHADHERAATQIQRLIVTALILSTQRRAGQLASHREQLTLELATLSEQKSAKTIALLEEIRRDNPLLPDRVDEDAVAMSESVDPESVLKAIIDTQEELKETLEPRPIEVLVREPQNDASARDT